MAKIIELPRLKQVGIIVLNRNRSKDILECIRSIYRQSYKPLVIVVVDNNSSDNSCELIRTNFPEVCLIENYKNYGVAGGRNIGIRYLTEKEYKTDFIMFLDNDATMKENCILEMISSFDLRDNIGIVTPKLLRPDGVLEYAGGIDFNLTTGRIINIGSGEGDTGQYNYCSESIPSSGGIFMIRNDVLKEADGFDENFNPYGWEDVDLSLRIRKNSYKIFYNYKAVIYHKGGKSLRGYSEEYELSKVKNYFYLVKKHSSFFQLVLFYFLLPFRLLVTSGKQIRNGGYKFMFMQLNSFLNVLFGRAR